MTTAPNPHGIKALRLAAAKAHVARCLQEVEPGERLPSIYEMMETSGATRTAITQALNHFQAEGALVIRPKSGTVKLGTPPPAANYYNIIDLVSCHLVGAVVVDTSFHGRLADAIHRTLSSHGYGVRMHQLHVKDGLNAYMKLPGLADSAGFILLTPALREMVVEFEKTGKPVVTAFPQARWRGGSQVIDAATMMRKQMDYLVSLGHERIVHLHPEQGGDEFYSRTHSHRRDDYFRIMAERGFRVYPHWIVDFDTSEAQLRAALERIFGSDPVPTALIVRDGNLPFVYRFLDARGLLPGRDVAVLATDGIDICQQVDPPATTMVNPFEDAARYIWELLDRQLRGDFTGQTRALELGFRQGRSTFALHAPARPKSVPTAREREKAAEPALV